MTRVWLEHDPLDPYDLVPADWTPAELDQLRVAVRNRDTLHRDAQRRQAVDSENRYRRGSRRWRT